MSNDHTAARIAGTLPPPPGQTSNFENPPNHDASMIALHVVCVALSTLFVSMRVGVRIFVLRQPGLDDVFCVAGWITAVTYSALLLKAMTLGLGRHLWDIPATQAVNFGKWLFIIEVESIPVWLMIKLAFFSSYIRIFKPVKAMRWLCYIGAFICTGFYVAELFHSIFVCVPVQKIWNPKLSGHCLPSGVAGSATGIFNVFTDLYILLIPLPFVWSLQMKTGPKLRLMALFAGGALANIASIIRLIITYQIAGDKDVSWKLSRLAAFVIVELNVGLICVCALLLPCFWHRVLLSTWSSLRSKSATPSGSNKPSENETDPERGLKLVHVHIERSPAASDASFPESYP